MTTNDKINSPDVAVFNKEGVIKTRCEAPIMTLRPITVQLTDAADGCVITDTNNVQHIFLPRRKRPGKL